MFESCDLLGWSRSKVLFHQEPCQIWERKVSAYLIWFAPIIFLILEHVFRRSPHATMPQLLAWVTNFLCTLRYYYHVDKSLHGGDMEFCGREPMDILGWGDCSNNYRSFGRESLRSALRGDARDPPKLTNCRVPISNSESTAAISHLR